MQQTLNREKIMSMTPEQILEEINRRDRALEATKKEQAEALRKEVEERRYLQELVGQLQHENEEAGKVYLEREDLRKQTTKHARVIADGRVTISQAIRDVLDIRDGDLVDVYRYSIDGEWPAKIMLSFPNATERPVKAAPSIEDKLGEGQTVNWTPQTEESTT